MLKPNIKWNCIQRLLKTREVGGGIENKNKVQGNEQKSVKI